MLKEVCTNSSAQEEFGLPEAELEECLQGLDAYNDMWHVGRLIAEALSERQGAFVPSTGQACAAGVSPGTLSGVGTDTAAPAGQPSSGASSAAAAGSGLRSPLSTGGAQHGAAQAARSW
jgi:hypothetical protein